MSVHAQTRYTLEQLVASALQRNTDLSATRQREQEAAGLLRQAGLQPNPSLGIEAGTGSILGSRGDYDFSVTYAHTFERGNKREIRIAANQPGVAIAKLEAADRERLIRAEITEAYGEALAAKGNIATLANLTRLNQDYLRIARARVDEGEAAPVEHGLLQLEFGRIEPDRLKLEADLNRALIALKTLAGLEPDLSIDLEGELTPNSIEVDTAMILDRALMSRPDLESARLDERAREADLRLARAQAVPDVVGFVRYTHQATRFDQFGLNSAGQPVRITNADNLLTGGFSIDLKTRNRNQGEIEAAMAREEAAKLRTAAISRTVDREVRVALSRYAAARKVVALFAGTLLNQSQQNLNAIRAAYEIGELRVFDLISEQRRSVEIQRSYVDALKELYLSRAEVERAIGGSLQ